MHAIADVEPLVTVRFLVPCSLLFTEMYAFHIIPFRSNDNHMYYFL